MPCAVVFSFVLSWSVSKRWTILTCQFAVLKCAVVVNSPWFDHAMTRIHDRIFVRIRPHTAVVFGWDPWEKQHSILGKVAPSGSFKNFARGSRLFSQIIRGARTMFNQRTMLNNTELCFSCSPVCFAQAWPNRVSLFFRMIQMEDVPIDFYPRCLNRHLPRTWKVFWSVCTFTVRLWLVKSRRNANCDYNTPRLNGTYCWMMFVSFFVVLGG